MRWSWFSTYDMKWYDIADTSDSLTIQYDDTYFDNDDVVKFRCIVKGAYGAIARIGNVYLQKVKTLVIVVL